MASRPATKLESILGLEKARACLQEIEDRIHPEDTTFLRSALIKDVLYRHIEKCDLSLKEMVSILTQEEKPFYNRLIGMLVDKTCIEIQADYLTKDDTEKG